MSKQMNIYFKEARRAYFLEAFLSWLINYALYLVIFTLYYFYLYTEQNTFLPVVLIWLTFEILSSILIYRTAITIFLDICNFQLVSKQVKIVSLESEYSWSGNFGYSKIGHFFKEELKVDRYKVRYESESGNGYIRVVLGRRNAAELMSFIRKNESKNTFDIKFLKRSKLLFNISPVKGMFGETEVFKMIKYVFKLW